MKNTILLALLAAWMFILPGGGQPDGVPPLEELPDAYSLEQAKADGCVTHENGDVTSGKETFETFYTDTKAGKKDSVRLAFYYTLGDSAHYDAAYYESVKNDYPMLFVQELSFDGTQYTLRWYEDGEEIIKNYACLMKYEGEPESPSASYRSYVRYVLTNDATVTWQDLFYGMVSARAEDAIDFQSVCTDLIYEEISATSK